MPIQFKTYLNLLFIIVLCFISFNVQAQVNTEAMRKAEMEDGFATAISAHQQLSKGNSEYSIYKGSARLDYLHEQYHTFLIANFKQGKKQEGRDLLRFGLEDISRLPQQK